MKKFLPLLLAFCLVLGMLPMTALAANDCPQWVEIGTVTLNASKPYYHNGESGAQGVANNVAAGANAIFDPSTGTLTLNNINFTNTTSGKRCIRWEYDSSLTKNVLTINVAAGTTNTLVNTYGAAINGESGWQTNSNNPSLAIEGSGTLNVTGSSYGIWVWRHITVGGSVILNVTGQSENAVSANQNGTSNVTIKENADVTFDGAVYGVGEDNTNKKKINFIIEGGRFTMKGGTAAMQVIPTYPEAYADEIIVSSNKDGSGALQWNKTTDLTSYKFAAIGKVLPKQDTPAGVFNASDVDKGTLSDISAGMMYSIDGGTTYTEATGTSVELTGVTAAKDIKIYLPGVSGQFGDSDVQTIDVTQPAAPALGSLNVVQPTTESGSGSVDTTAAMQCYKSTTPETIGTCLNGTNNYAQGTHYFRFAPNGTALASEWTEVVIAYTPSSLTKQPTPAAVFDATGVDTGVLSNVAAGMKYSVDGGSTYVAITEESVNLTGVTAANDIKVYMPGDGVQTADSDVQTIDVTQPAAPTADDLDVVQPTTENGTGSITTTDTMETVTDTANGDPENCSAGTDSYPAGKHYFRYKANGTALASEWTEVTLAYTGNTGNNGNTGIVPTAPTGSEIVIIAPDSVLPPQTGDNTAFIGFAMMAAAAAIALILRKSRA
ncbi:MAG: hypothetical protein E7330_01495 [Clostridiales bacterium]|nr:hypothetical protein [Clostridiales bacterium]